MPDEPKKPKKKPGGWSAARQHLSTWDKPALIALVKDLHDSSTANRNFIQARCQAADGGNEVIELYRNKIVEQFFPKRDLANSNSAKHARPSVNTKKRRAAYPALRSC